MSRFNRLAIRDHRPWRTALAILVLLAVVLAGAGIVYWREVGQALGTVAESAAQRRVLNQRVEQLAARNESLAAELAVLRRQAQVRQESYAKVTEDLLRKDNRIAELEDELRFYRGIFSRSLKDGSLGVHGLKLWPVDDAGSWAYRAVLTHLGKGDNVIEGSIALRARGVVGGSPQVLGADKLGDGASTAFRLKHFKQLEGLIRLPEGFEPTRVEVLVRTGEEGDVSVDQDYAWSEVVEP